MKTILVLLLACSILFGCNHPEIKVTVEKNDSSISKKLTKKDTSAATAIIEKKVDELTTTNNSVLVQTKTNDEIIVLSATSQGWHGGVRGSGGGTNYEICITADHSLNIVIDQLWIEQIWHSFRLNNKSVTLSPAGSQTFDTIYIYAADYHKDPLYKSIQNKDTTPQSTKPDTTGRKAPPFPYKGVALIGYKYGSRQVYKTVSAFKVKPVLNYP